MDPLWPRLNVVLLFPDRYIVLDCIDKPLAGLERFAAMWAANGHGDTRLARKDFAKSVDNRDPFHGPSPLSRRGKFLELGNRHFLIGFVDQVFGFEFPRCSLFVRRFGPAACGAGKQYFGATLFVHHSSQHGRCVNR